LTTDAGDRALEIRQDDMLDTVPGHVILKQDAVCTHRFDEKIYGRHHDKYFIQQLCSTVPGHACHSLLWMLSCFLGYFPSLHLKIGLL
jgi:hypothetical protein